MRILVLIHEYPPVGGGGGKVAEDIAEGLVSRGHEVRIITARLKGLPSKEKRGGVDVIRVHSGRKFAYKASFTAMALFLITGFWSSLIEIKNWKPDVIHVHFAVPAGVLGWLLSFLTKIPYLMTVHLGDVPGGVPEKTDKWFRWVGPFTPGIWKRAKKVVAVSAYTRELALKRYPVAIDVINNGVDTAYYDPGTLKVSSPPRILFVGRIVPQKNPLQVVRSLAEVKDLEWQCEIVGDGPLRNEMELEVEKLGIRNRVEFTGWVSPEEVKQWFGKSDILFMPSLSEGLPVVGVQALSMGLAFVTGKVGGFVDLVEDGKNGFLHLPTQPEEFSRSLRVLLTDRSKLLEFRRRSRKNSEAFDIVRIVEKYEKLILECKR